MHLLCAGDYVKYNTYSYLILTLLCIGSYFVTVLQMRRLRYNQIKCFYKLDQ